MAEIVPDHVSKRFPDGTMRRPHRDRRHPAEHLNDAALVGDKLDQGLSFSAMVDVLEWLGSDMYAYFLDTGSGAREGHKLDLWWDVQRAHLFNPDDGANLTL